MGNQLALIVEDDRDQASLFARVLQTAGFETEVARAGDTALARLAVMVPDVLHRIRGDPRCVQTIVRRVNAPALYIAGLVAPAQHDVTSLSRSGGTYQMPDRLYRLADNVNQTVTPSQPVRPTCVVFY